MSSERPARLLHWGGASIHLNAEKSSSRKPAVPKVATYRITSHPGEYYGPKGGTGAGRMGA